ncbi:MAG: hypothetical protein CL693_04270 [Cellvibrionaceae bacterium]|nr:hypothetical protein [Cellvibrionaceae bacterium]|tara:strand:- start:4486 stop:5448 length:963 start_codon:yes stop_codon:yes gene_type:complete
MNTCRICLDPNNLVMNSKFEGYHDKCVASFFGSLKTEPVLDLTEAQFYHKARSSKGMSISGVQAKLGVSVIDGRLVTCDEKSEYILKPCPKEFPELPVNEHLTMRLAKLAGQDVADCGLIKFSDGEYAYIVKRFDRIDDEKIHQEDLMQAMGKPNAESGSKYETSYEEAAACISVAEGGGTVEVSKFIFRIMFMYLIGNGDFHLKNTSILYPSNEPPKLTPIYDAVNTDIYGDSEFMALSLLYDDETTEEFDKLGFYSLADFIELGRRSGVPSKAVEKHAKKLVSTFPKFIEYVTLSYLDGDSREKYLNLLFDRIRAFDS